MKKKLLLLFSAFTLLCSSNVSALEIILNDTTGMTNQQLNAFNEAADLWESLFFDDVTVRIDIGMEDMGNTGIIGSALSYRDDVTYAAVRDALVTDSKSAGDAMATANLSATGYVPAVIGSLDQTQNPIGYIYTDQGYAINNNLYVNRANLKSLNLLADDGFTADASIRFNTQFAFDYQRDDGILGSQMDFIGVAAHEIGHALGFVSGVDILDYYTYPNGPGNPGNTIPDTELNAEDSIFFSVLDLYRYSELSLSYDALDWSVLGDAFFSIDGGVTDLAGFESGRYNGSGQQASHWLDNLGIGIMDPTFAFGEFGDITDIDILAMDVIGWDLTGQQGDEDNPVIPEPNTMLLFGVGLLCYARISRKK